ncbi:MAG: sulfotransferase [Gallionella sp.]|nr:sulfotransferase [Gallionella sp.]
MPQSPSFRFTPAPSSAPANLSWQQAFALATEHQAQGHLPQAEHLLRQILQQQPNHAPSLHLLGVIAHQCGKQALAAELIHRAIEQHSDVALFHANLCEILRQLKQWDKAIEHGERAIALAPSMAMAHSNLGIVYYDCKDGDRAEMCQRTALALEPDFAPSLNNMGNIYRERKQHGEALAWYRKAVAANPAYLEPLNNLGALLLEEDRVSKAHDALAQALRLHPNYAESVCNMGGVHLALEQNEAALAHFQRALALRPAYIEAQMGLAKALQALEALSEAEAAALHALQLDPKNVKAHTLLAEIYAESARPDQAEAEYLLTLALDPDNDDALLGLGHLCTENGQLERAEALFQKSLSLKPDNLAAHIHLVQVKKVNDGDVHFAALCEHEKTASALSENRKMSLHFALGKCYDDTRNYDQAFPHFLAGCKIKRAKIDHDPNTAASQLADLKSLFSKAYIDSLRGGGNPTSLPVFVLGMPRSGTTLTEQIIASHPDVYGAGELPDLLRIAHRKTAPDINSFPANLGYLKRDILNAWADEYIDSLQAKNPRAARITDKMPANFLLVPLIHLMLPNAKIIHVNRNPVDTCLSCFTRLFHRKQEHTYDLAELGRYYADYARMMAHWRTVLPANAFLDVHYEDIVADQETQARRLLDYCDLEWDERCLDFHKTKRQIRTASVTQVRQPIYTSSVERWRKYEKHLGPLFEALEEFSPERK